MVAKDQKRPGFFITLEGGEGVGKSTLATGLCKAILETGVAVTQTREPGGTPLAEAVRTLVLQPKDGEAWSPLAQALLMNAARADHVEKLILPALTEGHFVICDRFSDSTLAYQSIGGAVSRTTLRAMDAGRLSSVTPDLTFILDAAPKDVLERRHQRDGALDVFEARDLEFHNKVRLSFLEIARQDPQRCVILDATLPSAQLVDMAMTEIANRLTGNGRV